MRSHSRRASRPANGFTRAGNQDGASESRKLADRLGDDRVAMAESLGAVKILDGIAVVVDEQTVARLLESQRLARHLRALRDERVHELVVLVESGAKDVAIDVGHVGNLPQRRRACARIASMTPRIGR